MIRVWIDRVEAPTSLYGVDAPNGLWKLTTRHDCGWASLQYDYAFDNGPESLQNALNRLAAEMADCRDARKL